MLGCAAVCNTVCCLPYTPLLCKKFMAVHCITLQCMDLDPEYLPRRLLTDFSIYNAEVRRAMS